MDRLLRSKGFGAPLKVNAPLPSFDSDIHPAINMMSSNIATFVSTRSIRADFVFLIFFFQKTISATFVNTSKVKLAYVVYFIAVRESG